METWKDVVGYEGLYEVSNLGNVRNTVTGRILKPQSLRHGYVGVWLYGKDGISKRNGKPFSVHRIVAKAFCDNPNGFEEVNHKNEIKSDNRAENLEWCSHSYNSGYGNRGSKIGAANTNGKRAKAVDQYTIDGVFVRTYPSIHEVGRNGYRVSNVHKAMQDEWRTAHGYKWRYHK